MAKAPAFQFYARDWQAGTSKFTCAERGAYITLLAAQWEDGGLPPDVKRLAMIAQCPQDEFSVVWLAIREKFPLCEDGLLRNRRLEEERQKQIVHRERQADKGKLGAEVRWKDHKKQSLNSNGHVAAMPKPSPENGFAFASASASALASLTATAKSKATTPQAALPVIPDWVPRKPWEAFLEMRKRMRCVPTAHAYGLLIEKLDRLRASGQDPGAVLDQSTEHNWRGLFPVREAMNGNADRDRRVIEGAFERIARRSEKPVSEESGIDRS